MSKSSAHALAIFGGPPAFAKPKHVGYPNLANREKFFQRLSEMWDRAWLTNDGPFVQEFERRLAEMLDVPECIATSNATLALQLLAAACELEGEVIMPSFTFPATAHAFEWQGLTPVFADVDPRTHNLSPHRVRELVTSRTCAIVGVHLWGRGCAVEELSQIADQHGLHLFFDAAHAIGCSHQGVPIGGFGDAEVFSFHATKVVNSFEGGAITTRNPALAARLRKLRNFGFGGNREVEGLGTNAKMSEPCAAMGLTSLESLADFVAINRRNAEAYHGGLLPVPGLALAAFDESEHNNHQYVVYEVDQNRCPLTRDELLEVLAAENILARRYFHPGCHKLEPYTSREPSAGTRLPVTERLCREVLALPTGQGMSRRDVQLVGHVLRSAIQQADLVRAQLQRTSIPRVA